MNPAMRTGAGCFRILPSPLHMDDTVGFPAFLSCDSAGPRETTGVLTSRFPGGAPRSVGHQHPGPEPDGGRQWPGYQTWRTRRSHQGSPTEKSHDRNSEKFGSGNGVNTHGDFPFKSLFLKNTRFTGEKTVHYRSVRKCAKPGQPVAGPGLRRSPDDRYGLKIKGFPRGPKNDFFS
jgi:hypothetical protein